MSIISVIQKTTSTELFSLATVSFALNNTNTNNNS